eukprot:366311-Chlamydomonas_euryale.AAC.21
MAVVEERASVAERVLDRDAPGVRREALAGAFGALGRQLHVHPEAELARARARRQLPTRPPSPPSPPSRDADADGGKNGSKHGSFRGDACRADERRRQRSRCLLFGVAEGVLSLGGAL